MVRSPLRAFVKRIPCIQDSGNLSVRREDCPPPHRPIPESWSASSARLSSPPRRNQRGFADHVGPAQHRTPTASPGPTRGCEDRRRMPDLPDAAIRPTACPSLSNTARIPATSCRVGRCSTTTAPPEDPHARAPLASAPACPAWPRAPHRAGDHAQRVFAGGASCMSGIEALLTRLPKAAVLV